jgi:hypothetical protein
MNFVRGMSVLVYVCQIEWQEDVEMKEKATAIAGIFYSIIVTIEHLVLKYSTKLSTIKSKRYLVSNIAQFSNFLSSSSTGSSVLNVFLKIKIN